MQLNKKELELIQEVAGFNGIELRVYEGYSGRGMLSFETTTGLVVNYHREFQELMVEVAIKDNDLGRKLARAKSDNLAFQYIYY